MKMENVEQFSAQLCSLWVSLIILLCRSRRRLLLLFLLKNKFFAEFLARKRINQLGQRLHALHLPLYNNTTEHSLLTAPISFTLLASISFLFQPSLYSSSSTRSFFGNFPKFSLLQLRDLSPLFHPPY